MQLHRWDPDRDGALTEAAMRSKLEALGRVVMRYVYPPGAYFPPHTHDVDKIDGVLPGRFRLEMGGRSVILETGDMPEIPRREVHSAEVVGAEPVVAWTQFDSGARADRQNGPQYRVTGGPCANVFGSVWVRRR